MSLQVVHFIENTYFAMRFISVEKKKLLKMYTNTQFIKVFAVNQTYPSSISSQKHNKDRSDCAEAGLDFVLLFCVLRSYVRLGIASHGNRRDLF